MAALGSVPGQMIVNVRGWYLPPVDTDIAVSNIIGQDHDHVGPLLRRRKRRCPQQGTHDQ
jgi:hypothetical protein